MQSNNEAGMLRSRWCGVILINLVTTSPQGRVRSIVWWVCLSVRLHNSKNARQSFTKFFVQVAYGLDSVFFWRRCNTPCISGFVMTSCFHVMALWRVSVYFSVERDKRNSRDSNQILFTDKDRKLETLIASSAPGWSLLSMIALFITINY